MSAERVIKFRAWDALAEQMFGINYSPQEFWSSVHPASCDVFVMQFTGLKDKNGKEIYEGDIIAGEDGEPNETVIYKENKFILTPLGDDAVYWNKCEVIGNIYDNPELLEQQQ